MCYIAAVFGPEDFSVVATIEPVVVPPGTSALWIQPINDGPVHVAVRYRAQGGTRGRVSLQVRTLGGETRIFTDGFESGDTSAW